MPAKVQPLKGQSTVFARQMQVLRYHWDGLTPGDLRRICGLIEESTQLLANQNNLPRIEAAFAVAACLFTGRRLSDLSTLRYSRIAYWPDADYVALGLVRCAENWGWYLPAGLPGERTAHDPRGGTDKNLWIQAPDIVRELAILTLRARGLSQTSDAPIFSSSLNDLRASAKSLLKSDSGIRRAGTTLEAVERWLFGAIVLTAGGDAALAQFVTGNTPFKSKTTSSYTGCTQDQVENVWHRAMTQVMPVKPRRAPHTGLRVQRYGTMFCPDDAHLAVLRNKLTAALQNAASPDRYHSALTHYTVVLSMLGMAVRPAHYPVLPYDGIDPATGFIVVEDDRQQDPFMSRLGWAPPVVRTQLAIYRSHLNRLANSKHGAALAAIRSTQPNHLAITQIEHGVLRSVTLYEVVKDIKKVHNINLKENFARHFLRTKLLGKCSTETLQALMGHWNQGTDPSGRGSGFDPLLYRADLERTLPELLDQHGWSALGAA